MASTWAEGDPGPFWLASSMDGHGSAYYTFGDRKRQNLTTYREGMVSVIESIAKIVIASREVVLFHRLRSDCRLQT